MANDARTGAGGGASPSPGAAGPSAPAGLPAPEFPDPCPARTADLVRHVGEHAARRDHRPVRHGVRLAGDSQLTAGLRAWAEVLARPDAVLSGRAAAVAHRHPWTACEPEVLLGGRLPDVPAPGVRGRRRRPAARPIAVTPPLATRPIRLAAPVDVCIDCVAGAPDDASAIAFLDGALRAWGRFGLLDDLHRWTASAPAGAARMESLLSRADVLSESRPESHLRVRLADAGDPGWVPQYRVEAPERTYWLDLADPVYRIGLEYQGVGHWGGDSGPSASVRADDARRASDLRILGWTIIEVTAHDLWRDFDELCDRIGQVRRRINAARAHQRTEAMHGRRGW